MMRTQPTDSLTNKLCADDLTLVDLLSMVVRRWRVVLGGSMLVGAATFGASFLITPQFTARTTFLPPQSGSGAALNAALSSLGPLAGLAGGTAGSGKNTETYVALLGSRTLNERLVERHQLKDLYGAKYNFEALAVLKSHTRIEYSKRDGIVAIEFDDVEPARAALIANDYVDQLRVMTGSMSLTEVQRRRAFLEEQLNQSRRKLSEAQTALQGSGFNEGALRAEPRAAADEYGRIKAELTSTEVRLNAIRSRLAEGAPEIMNLIATAAALRSKLAALGQRSEPAISQDYVGRYREFKYQEALYEQLARQFEAARLEESREDNTIQVIDSAVVPEWKSKPKRASIGLVAALIAALVISVAIVIGHMRGLSRPPARLG